MTDKIDNATEVASDSLYLVEIQSEDGTWKPCYEPPQPNSNNQPYPPHCPVCIYSYEWQAEEVKVARERYISSPHRVRPIPNILRIPPQGEQRQPINCPKCPYQMFRGGVCMKCGYVDRTQGEQASSRDVVEVDRADLDGLIKLADFAFSKSDEDNALIDRVRDVLKGGA